LRRPCGNTHSARVQRRRREFRTFRRRGLGEQTGERADIHDACGIDQHCRMRDFEQADAKSDSDSAETRLQEMIDKFDPYIADLIRSVRKALRRRLPGAVELVYDNYNFFVIGYGPNERASEAVLSIAAQARGVSICFIQGAKLPDPTRLLIGSGKQTRSLRVETADVLLQPAVEELIKAALVFGEMSVPNSGGYTVIKSVSEKQRPRRKLIKRA
jgi:hypothetical protein